jgi:arylsulfatase A-like enzyme
VTADHGEAFGEHGLYKHAFWLWEVLVRVPLIVHVPGNPPRRIDVKRSQVDLAPTIADFMHIQNPPTSFVGRSMVPEIEGRAPADDRDPIVLDLPEDSHNPQVRAIVRGDLKLIVYGEGRKELYDLSADPAELHDLSKAEPDKLATMKAEFDRVWSTIPFVEPYGGNKLREGRTAKGPIGP